MKIDDVHALASSVLNELRVIPEKPNNPRYGAKLARDGALLHLALCEFELDRGDKGNASSYLTLADQLVRLSDKLDTSTGAQSDSAGLKEIIKKANHKMNRP